MDDIGCGFHFPCSGSPCSGVGGMPIKWITIYGGVALAAASIGLCFIGHLRYGSPLYDNLSDQCYSLKIGDGLEPFKLKVLVLQARQAYPTIEAFDPKLTGPMLAEFKDKGFGRGERESLCSVLEYAVTTYGVPR